MALLRIKNFLLACTIMLGLQVFFPLVANADDNVRLSEEISLGTKDLEKKDKLLLDLDLLTIIAVAANGVSSSSRIALSNPVSAASQRCYLLRGPGCHPSAP